MANLHICSSIRLPPTYILKNTDDWCNWLNLGILEGLVFIDLKKALDAIDHKTLR